MQGKVQKCFFTILVSLVCLLAIYYVIPFHGTRAKEIYDIGKEAELNEYNVLQLEKGKKIEQHFIANTYCLKGINYVLIGIDEQSIGSIEWSIETLENRELLSKEVEYKNIVSGQWENVELPVHLKQGREYIVSIQNLAEEVTPMILTGSAESVSNVERELIIGGQMTDDHLYLGFGFRPEFTRMGKIFLCLMIILLWSITVYSICFKERNTEHVLCQLLPFLYNGNGITIQKKYYFDFLRIIAIWMVIYNHTVLNGYMLFTEERGTIIFWFEQFFSIFIKIAVPLFWMMSGALLLNREEDIKTLLKKRVLRFFIVLILFTALQYMYKIYTGKITPEMGENYFHWVYQYTEGVMAYWYLYAYLGYLLMLPLIRKIAKGLKRAEYLYVFIIYTVYTGILPMFEYFVLQERYHLRDDFQIPILTSACIVFALMGYYIERVKSDEEFTGKRFAGWVIGSIFAIIVTALATTYRCEINQKWSEIFTQYFFNCFIIVPAYTVFYGVKFWSLKHSVVPGIKKVISFLGGATFGLMLIENIVREQMNFVFDLLIPHFGKFLGGIFWVSSIVIVGLLIAAIMKKIPGLNKIL